MRRERVISGGGPQPQRADGEEERGSWPSACATSAGGDSAPLSPNKTVPAVQRRASAHGLPVEPSRLDGAKPRWR